MDITACCKSLPWNYFTFLEAPSYILILIKDKDTMGKFIVGKSKFVFEPVDEEGNPIDISKIGNGTKCYALVSSYRHKMSAKFGAAPSIKKLVVTELKVYVPERSDKEETADDVL